MKPFSLQVNNLREDVPNSGFLRNELTKLLFEFPERFTIDEVICLLRRKDESPELPATMKQCDGALIKLLSCDTIKYILTSGIIKLIVFRAFISIWD